MEKWTLESSIAQTKAMAEFVKAQNLKYKAEVEARTARANIPIAICTVERPENYLAQTLASLAIRRPIALVVGSPETGFLGQLDPSRYRFVVPSVEEYSEVAGLQTGYRASWNYARCLGVGEGQPRLLIFEDDVRFATGWEKRLATTVERIESKHADYALSLYYPYGRQDDGKGYFVYPERGFMGFQGMLFAGRSIAGFREYVRERHLQIKPGEHDLLLEGYAAREGIPIFATMPSLVQHTGVKTSIQTGGFHQSPCFEERVGS
jgi:hypothetical protein